MENKILAFFEEVDIYHSPLDKMTFDFEKSKIIMSLSVWDYMTEKYVALNLCFTGVFGFFSDYPEDVGLSHPTCYAVSCAASDTGKYEVSWILLLDNQPLWEVRIAFTGLEIQGGLSPEAKEYRDKLMES